MSGSLQLKVMLVVDWATVAKTEGAVGTDAAIIFIIADWAESPIALTETT